MVGLVEEFAVGVLAEQGLSNRWGGGDLEEVESGLDGIIDIDLSVATNDVYATGPALVSI